MSYVRFPLRGSLSRPLVDRLTISWVLSSLVLFFKTFILPPLPVVLISDPLMTSRVQITLESSPVIKTGSLFVSPKNVSKPFRVTRVSIWRHLALHLSFTVCVCLTFVEKVIQVTTSFLSNFSSIIISVLEVGPVFPVSVMSLRVISFWVDTLYGSEGMVCTGKVGKGVGVDTSCHNVVASQVTYLISNSPSEVP